MEDASSVSPSRKWRGYAVKLVLIISPVIYVLIWNLIVRYHLLSILTLPFRMISSPVTQEWAKVQVGASAEVVVWRRGVIPAYWSRMGDLTPFHTVFSIAYLFYIASSIFRVGQIKDMKAPKRLAFLNFAFVKRFWLVFGIIAFLTTSLSTVAILSDLLALVYYVAYLISLPMAPITLYLWGKRGGNPEKNVNKS
jgi:hypothetical protein